MMNGDANGKVENPQEGSNHDRAVHENDNVLNVDDYEVYRLDYEMGDDNDNKRSSSQPVILAAGGEILQPGAHIYMWCTGYQHHGVVLSMDNDHDEPSMLIAEFTNVALVQADTLGFLASTASGATSGGGVAGGFRIVRERIEVSANKDNDGGSDQNKWHKVKYRANPLECMTWRPGTCSAAIPSQACEILSRVQFLHDCRHLLPDYHLLASNCETVAVWCVTGKWQTLQYQHTMKWSQVGALAGVGLLPVVPGVGMVAAGLAFLHSKHIQNQWKETAERLNKDFEWYKMGRTPKLQFHESS